MIWAGHVARMGEENNAYMIKRGKRQKENHHKEDKDVSGSNGS
jgi:hypothetical protein